MTVHLLIIGVHGATEYTHSSHKEDINWETSWITEVQLSGEYLK